MANAIAARDWLPTAKKHLPGSAARDQKQPEWPKRLKLSYNGSNASVFWSKIWYRRFPEVRMMAAEKGDP
ncbi:hypothetical protein NECAME_10031 [Necator americanus]|uniref:Uncharacterized protein n=1 Tax=Necator americanus TaxID=51031 RepID=W2TBY9_NECAM|nr:hypothetical protein NECAME_10031 [Necator americanus]ETN79114.1 hypothetical protein NECAME_10031 [Necator americanus]